MDHVYTSGGMKVERLSPIEMEQKADVSEHSIVEEGVNIADDVDHNNIYIKEGELYDHNMKSVLLKVASNPSSKRRIVLKGDLISFIKEQEKEREKNIEKTPQTPQPQKWSREAINLLISLRTQLSEYFDNPKNKKMDYWTYLSNILTQAGFEISGPECHVKWRNLCCTYRMNMERVHRLGPQAVRWEFFEQMDACLKNKMPEKNDIDDNEIEEEDSDDDAEMSRLLKIQSKIVPAVKVPSPSKQAHSSSSPPPKRLRASSPPLWFKEYIQKRDHEEKMRDEKFFSILEAIKESELRKTALLETLLQYFDRN